MARVFTSVVFGSSDEWSGSHSILSICCPAKGYPFVQDAWTILVVVTQQGEYWVDRGVTLSRRQEAGRHTSCWQPASGFVAAQP